MADSLTRATSLYIDGDKVAQMMNLQPKINGNVSQKDTSDGIVYIAGRVKTSMSFKTMIILGGQRVRVTELVISQKLVTLEWFNDNRRYSCTGILSEANGNVDFNDGTNEGDYSFIGGTPASDQI